jgi:6-phosphogluconolactonase
MSAGRLEIFRNPERQATGVADWLVTRMMESHGDFRLVLSGGNTPRLLYEHLGRKPYRDRVPWRRLRIFWGDERFVPHNDPASNFSMALGAFLLDAPIPRAHVHPIPTDGTAPDAARRYEALLRDIRATDGEKPTRPLFDAVLLGIGADGHTASLFPESPALEEEERWVVAIEGQSIPRISLTLPAIANSRHVAFLVAGADKQKAAMRAIGGDRALPAARVRSEGEVIWFLDREAAAPLYHK